MAKFIFLLLLIAGMLNGNCQSKKEKEQKINDLFYNAEKYMDDSALDKAITTYKEIIQITKRRSVNYSKAVFNLGYIYYLQGNDSAAEKVFYQILGRGFNEMDKGGRGSGIMQEPYALYKHNACEVLAEIEFKRNNHAKALEYIYTFDRVYPYRHFCGNELASNRIYTAEMYSRAYAGQKDTISAIRVLLPHVVESGLASNTDLVNTAVSLLKAKYDSQYLIDELNNAINTLSAHKVKPANELYEIYRFTFMDVLIPVWADMMNGDEYKDKTEVERRKLFVRQSRFYKLITGQIKPEELNAFR